MSPNFKKIENFNDAKKYLDSFIDYEKKDKYPYRKSFKLNRVEALFIELNINYNKLKAIHIAGTKGKGSTATFCSYILAASGFRVGLYTSPHFFNFRERIRIVKSEKLKVKSYLISRKDVVRILREIQPFLEKLRFNKDLGGLTFFEVYTAIAFKYFLEKKLDFVVLETGLGGRLDATNVVTPLVSIITHIGLDHMDKLGKTLNKITAEKAGIIKKKIAAVSTLQTNTVSRVIEKKCKAEGAELFILGRDFRLEKISLDKTRTSFNFRSRKNNLSNLRISLKGKYQAENAALSIMAIFLLKQKGLIKSAINFKQGLAAANIDGRFETALRKPLVIADVAHNPSAFGVLQENLKRYFPAKKIILIFAAARDKDIKKMLKKLYFSNIILTTFNNPRAFMPQEVKDICKIKNAIIAKDVREAFSIAKTLYDKDSLILISGSLFLVAEAKRMLQAAGYKLQDRKS